MLAFPEKNVTEVYGSTLLALRGGGWGSNSQEVNREVSANHNGRHSPLISDATYALFMRQKENDHR